MKDSKLLFVVFIYRHSPERYEQLWKKGLRRLEDWAGGQFRSNESGVREKFKQQIQSSYEVSNPLLHRYNDVAGFAEVVWSGGLGIEANYYFQADRRTKFGRLVKSGDWRANPRRFYPVYYRINRVNVATCADSEQLRAAADEVLLRVEETAADLKCWADTSSERAMLRRLHIVSFLQD